MVWFGLVWFGLFWFVMVWFGVAILGWFDIMVVLCKVPACAGALSVLIKGVL